MELIVAEALGVAVDKTDVDLTAMAGVRDSPEEGWAFL